MTNFEKIHNSKLGDALPNDLHAVSVSLPTWADCIGYEEGEERVHEELKAGYPRFVFHPLIKKLFKEAELELAYGEGEEQEFCLIFNSKKVVEDCIKFCGGGGIEVFPTSSGSLYAYVARPEFRDKAKSFWQHNGNIISSREAEFVLNSKFADLEAGNKAKEILKKRIAKLYGELSNNVYLSPSGMASIYSIFEIVTSGKNKNKTTIQLGFPYVDTLKIQEKFGTNSVLINYKDENDLEKFERFVKENEVCAVFTEFPCNPLITCIDLERVSKICKQNNVILVVDDTLTSFVNAKTHELADISVSSLTKFFSGYGNVLAGSLVLNSQSPFHKELSKNFLKYHQDLLFEEDAIVLEQNSRDFEERMAKINSNTENFIQWLKDTKAGEVLYTKGNITYEKLKRADGGYGGVFSLVFDSESKAQRFYDALELAKGPSLGNNFTLTCPYVVLAHYFERDFIADADVPFHLLRISVGLEDLDFLKERFEKAFKAL